MGGSVITFGADMSFSVHVHNKSKDILIFGEGPAQGLDDTTFTTKVIYPINFTKPNKRFVLSLHYNGSNSFLFVNVRQIHEFKAKTFKAKDYKLCLGNISKNFTINYIKNGIWRGCKKFSVVSNPY